MEIFKVIVAGILFIGTIYFGNKANKIKKDKRYSSGVKNVGFSLLNWILALACVFGMGLVIK